MTRLLTTIAPLLLLAAGCSSTKLAYDKADWYLEREVDRWLCPGDRDEAFVEREIERLHAWHRRHELPRYVKDLRRIARGLAGPMEREQVTDLVRSVTRARDRLMKRMRPPAVKLLSRLGRRQTGCLALRVTVRYKEALDEVKLERADYARKRRDKLVKGIERWVGDLDDGQRRRLARRFIDPPRTARNLATAHYNAGLRLLHLTAIKDPARRRARLRAALSTTRGLYNARERGLLEARSRRMRARLWQLARMLSTAQRSTFRGKLLELARDFEVLSRAR